MGRWAGGVSMSNFVEEKLRYEDDFNNYISWREQMLCFIESQELLGHISEEWEEKDGPRWKHWRKNDSIVKGWIFCALSNELRQACVGCFSPRDKRSLKSSVTARDVWLGLERMFVLEEPSPPASPRNERDFFDELFAQELEELRKNLKSQTQDPESKGRKNDKLKLDMYEAANKGKWKKATKALKDKTPEDGKKRSFPEDDNKTVFRFAVKAGKDARMFLKLLVKMMSKEELRFKDETGSNALHLAAAEDNITAATILVEKDQELMHAKNKKNEFPIHVAAKYANKHVLHYLRNRTKIMDDCYEDKDRLLLLLYLIDADFFDMALQLVTDCPKIAKMKMKLKEIDDPPEDDKRKETSAVEKMKIKQMETISSARDPGSTSTSAPAPREDDKETSALERLCERDSAFLSGSPLNLWQRLLYFCFQRVIMKSEATPDVDNDNTAQEAAPGVDNDNTAQSPTDDEDSNVSGMSNSAADVEKQSYKPPKAGGNNFGLDFRSVFQKCPWLKKVDILQPVKKIFMVIKNKRFIHQQAINLLIQLCKNVNTIDEEERVNIYSNCIATAARLGIPEVIEVIREKYSDATSLGNKDGRYFYQVAAIYRSEKVLNLIFKEKGYKKYRYSYQRDSNGNTLLHLVANIAPQHKLNRVAGAALQMQRELQWFKEIEQYVSPPARSLKNKAGQTARIVFTETHKKLKEEGEKWMKDTAQSCIIVASLIATVVFGAAITVPGGNNSSTGYPMFKDTKAFAIFAVSDAFSLFTSVTSLLIFLSIMTSRYAEQDFLVALPNRLCIGLITLFLSILFMMTAFCLTIHLVFPPKDGRVNLSMILFACAPVLAFASLQAPLLVEFISSTYCGRILH